MNISEQVSIALAQILRDELTGIQIDSGISASINSAEDMRVVVYSSDAQMRKPSLPGLYDVSGDVMIMAVMTSDNAVDNFNQLCDTVNQLLGGKYSMPALFKSIDPDLHVYSYQWLGSNLGVTADQKCFTATYQWTVFARNTPNTTT